jgi:hypothetical protein
MEGGNRPAFSVICNICFPTWGESKHGSYFREHPFHALG